MELTKEINQCDEVLETLRVNVANIERVLYERHTKKWIGISSRCLSVPPAIAGGSATTD
jgi:hypothetical protein